jgi:mRNA interferase RelE/StbE
MRPEFEILYHPDVPAKDLLRISLDIKLKIKKAIETKLTLAPQDFGAPLRKTLKGYWKLRVGDYRVIYKIVDKTVIVFRMGHRREVYEK